ncbi:cytochrome c oxidase subunit 3 [Methylomicrobium sp. RS1]|jgi:cytochrome c oxidase subunit 3|uniref:cytochrome c oxidase subunit 3 n=1 Tax=Candidatus Methylomicrobium oryzae TaxID=2802053 RepID=UPI0019247771|nr:cytochrome c oxidase subunit 3 [Methylomicrobium sp. RS1]MBL1264263.1 heme-copper oxidase subunit III [Methylomicrobium sp. RS1]
MIDTISFRRNLPVGAVGHRALGWWGMWMLIATEAALFAYLLFSYFYLLSQSQNIGLPATPPSLRLALPNTFILIGSSLILWWGERGMRRGRMMRQLAALGLALALGVIFMAVQGEEWRNKTFSITEHAYGSLYFTVTGFHMLHVLGGALMLAALFVWTALGHFNAERNAPITIGALYWHFVDAVWLTIFGSFYLYPYLL